MWKIGKLAEFMEDIATLPFKGDEERKLELKMPFLGLASLCQVVVDETVLVRQIR
jgi:hypothetical protein